MDKKEFKNQFGELVEIDDKRWGKFISFVPNKLPPTIEFDKTLVLALTKAESLLSKLSGVGLLLPNPDLLIIPYLKKEALSSSRIEGTRISLDEYFLSEAQDNQEENIEALEVLNYINAINYALEEIQTKPITNDLIKETHKILMNNVRGKDKFPGEFRKFQNWIGLPGSKPQNANFVPPSYIKIEKLVKEMIEYMDTYDEMPLLIKCAFMHYQFETIHPFCDGNGRIGRALIVLYLIKKNKISKPILYISGFFEKYKPDYARLLSEANKRGNFRDWLLFFLEALKTQSEEALDKAIMLQKLKEDYRNKVQSKSQITSMIQLVDHLFINPYITIKKVEKITNSTYPTAKKLVETLVSLEILELKDKKSQRNKIYRAREILEIISN